MKAFRYALIFLRYPFYRVILSSDRNGWINPDTTNWTEEVEIEVDRKMKVIRVYFIGMC